VVDVPVLVVSALVVVVSALVVLVVSVVAVVSVLVVDSVVVGESARAAAAAPLPKRTIVASVAISFLRAMGRDYRRYSNLLLWRASFGRSTMSGQMGWPSFVAF